MRRVASDVNPQIYLKHEYRIHWQKKYLLLLIEFINLHFPNSFEKCNESKAKSIL
jgi:hypothetical protein